jgi:hypothetical protein
MADVQDEPPSDGGVGLETAPDTDERPRSVIPIHIIIKLVEKGYHAAKAAGDVAAEGEALWALSGLFRRPKRCVKCKKKIPRRAKFCPFCGAEQPGA